MSGKTTSAANSANSASSANIFADYFPRSAHNRLMMRFQVAFHRGDRGGKQQMMTRERHLALKYCAVTHLF
jgi:hypothetical protein